MSSQIEKGPILVVAQDAGGAEILVSYVRSDASGRRFDIYAAGAASKIFRREGMNARSITSADLKRVISLYRGGTALLGTGHPTESLELAALQEAKRQGLRTISWLDSWKRFRERYGYPAKGWKNNLPDQIMAGDPVAYALAVRYFPAVKVRRAQNPYFNHIRSSVRSLRQKPDAVLFLSAAGDLSYKLLKALLDGLSGRDRSPRIIVRLHPLDDAQVIASLLRASLADAVLSDAEDLARDLAQAKVAVGGETTALAAAAYAGIPTICLWRVSIPLPFKKMRRVSSESAAVRAVLEVA